MKKDVFPKGERTRLFWEKRHAEYWPEFPKAPLEHELALEQRARRERWREEGRELERGRARDWCARNPEKVREYGRRYRAKRNVARDKLRKLLLIDPSWRPKMDCPRCHGRGWMLERTGWDEGPRGKRAVWAERPCPNSGCDAGQVLCVEGETLDQRVS